VAISVGRADHLRPDLTTVPLEGVEPCHVVLATRAGDQNRLLAAFSKTAEAHLAARRLPVTTVRQRSTKADLPSFSYVSRAAPRRRVPGRSA
jgi:hypothetical protein